MNIYVGNLPFRTTEEELGELFAKYGAVDSAKIVYDRETGRSRGFAFVEMRDSQSGKQAIEGLNEKQIAGRSVTVNEARPRENRGGGGGRDRW